MRKEEEMESDGLTGPSTQELLAKATSKKDPAEERNRLLMKLVEEMKLIRMDLDKISRKY